MLSLLETSHLAFEGDMILDEALTFSRTHVNEPNIKKIDNPAVSELVSHSLELPLHHRTPKLEVRWYIGPYKTKEKTQITCYWNWQSWISRGCNYYTKKIFRFAGTG